MGMTEEAIQALNPGIRETVLWFNEMGYQTCDSGDGETHDFECDRGEPYVVIRVHDTEKLISCADDIKSALEARGIVVAPYGNGHVSVEASYDASDKMGFINVTGICDAALLNKGNA